MYQGFANVYDYLMTDTPYDQWYDLLLQTIKKYDVKGKQVLDLACGTGEMTHRLSKDGYVVLGVDLSTKMLEEAQHKSHEQALKCKFINQDIRALDLFQKYDLVVSFCDAVNYMIEDDDLLKMLQSIYKYLNEDGLFVLELSSYYKLSQVLNQNTFTEVDDDVVYIWDNYFDEATDVLEFDLTLFVEKNGLYERFDEYHKQRAYSLKTIKDLLEVSHLQCLEVLDSNTGKAVTHESERWLLIGRRKHE